MFEGRMRESEGASTPTDPLTNQPVREVGMADANISTRVCRKCGIVKSYEDFPKMQQGYRPRCKPCHAEDSKAWAIKNRDKIDARLAKIREANRLKPKRVPQTREEKLAKKRAYNVIWSARNHQRFMQMRKAWSEKNKHVEMERVRRRQAAQRKATPKWANISKMREFYRLALDKTEATGVKWSVDHIVPLISDVVCGLHVEHNMQVLPFSDNVRKGNRVWPDMP